MVHVYYHTFKAKEIKASTLVQMKDHLPRYFADSASRFRLVEDGYRSLVGKLLLARGYNELTAQKIDWSNYVQENLHKPKLKNGPCFNISHSGNVVVVAISLDCEVGIDTEEIKPMNFEGFKENFLPAEWMWLQTDSNKLKCLRFYLLWTRKEAILKATGQGLSLSLTSFNVLNERVDVLGQQWHLLNLKLDEGSVTHLASEKGIYDLAELRIKNCNLRDLIHESKTEEA